MFSGGTPQLTLTNSTVTGNTAQNFPGGGINLLAGSTATITGTTFSNNRATGTGTASGGALYKQGGTTLTVTDSTFTENRADLHGGAVGAFGAGLTTLDKITVTDNSAGANGGGILLGANVTLKNSTVSGNTATATGGGLWASAAAATPATIISSTISGNTGADGGGVGITGAVSLTNATIRGNTATTLGGGIAALSGSLPTFTNTIFAANQGPAGPQNCEASGAMASSGGGNLDDGTTCGALTEPTDQTNTAAGLSPTLADNGGPTPTHALLEGSAAINAGVAGACPATDQRGFARQGVCDIGAFEFGAAAAAVRAGAEARRKATPR